MISYEKRFKDILNVANQFLVGHISQRICGYSCGWNGSGRDNIELFVSTTTFPSQLQDKHVSGRKFETCSIFLSRCMQTGGVSFIKPVLLTVEVKISIFISKTSRTNNIRDSTSLYWILVLLILPITLLHHSHFLFSIHVYSFVFIYLLLVLGFLTPIKSMMSSTIPTRIDPSSARYIPLIWSAE